MTALIVLSFLNIRLSPLLRSLAAVEAEKIAEERIATAILSEMERQPTLYRDIIALSYKSDGSIASLSADTARLIVLRNRLSHAVLSNLDDENLNLKIPFSSLFGLNFLPSTPHISLPLRATRSYNAYFSSQFSERGINQTRHSIIFCVSIEMAILIPSRIYTVRIVREFPFAETVIVGEVPEAYTKIDRFTDDISETEIDDIYDFGASVADT